MAKITKCYFNQQHVLLFEIVKGDRRWNTGLSLLDVYVDEREIIDWIKNDTCGTINTLDDYVTYLGRVGTEQRVQLFYDDYKLFSCNIEVLKEVFGSFKTQKPNNGGILKLKKIIDENDEAIVPVKYDQSVYKGDVIAFVMISAINGDLAGILKRDIEFVYLDAAFNVMENLEISSFIWSTGVAEIYIRARIKKSLKELKQMYTVPGVIKSCVVKSAIKNIVLKMERDIEEYLWRCRLKMGTMNGCIIPSQDCLSDWISMGLQYARRDTPQTLTVNILMSKSALLKCLQLYDCHHTRGMDKLGIREAVKTLVGAIDGEKRKLSQDLIDIWRMVWKMFHKSIERWVFAQSLMLMCYYLSIQTGDYSDWRKGWIHLLGNKDAAFQWHYFVRDVCVADCKHSIFENTNDKNDWIMKGIRRYFCIVGTQEHFLLSHGLRFIPQVINWLYGVSDGNSSQVSTELVYNVNQASNVLGQFNIVCAIYKYFVFKRKNQCVEFCLQEMFDRHLPM